MSSQFILPLKGARSLRFKEHTLVMGILNATPDSFYDGRADFGDTKALLEKVNEMVCQGADIIDIGGESTRPGSKKISANEEIQRTIPLIKTIRKQLGSNIIISIDTYKSAVAEQAIEAGADMVNSLGGMTRDPHMADIVSRYKCPLVIYHIQGNPDTMQQGDIYYENVIEDIIRFFEEQIEYGRQKGIHKNQFLLDPGIGFGKTTAHNLQIIKHISEFKKLQLPILIGVSRKTHLGTILKESLGLAQIPPPEERLEASLAETAVAVLNGANIVRTHDVLPTKKILAVLDVIKSIK